MKYVQRLVPEILAAWIVCLKIWTLFTFFFTLATIFLITIFMGITLLFFENLGLCSPSKEGFICECGKRATPDSLISKNLCTALICPPIPLFLRQLFEPRDLLGDRSTCEKVWVSFFAFFLQGCLFLHSSCWLSAKKLKWLNSILKFFSSGDQSFRAAKTYFQERVKD